MGETRGTTLIRSLSRGFSLDGHISLLEKAKQRLKCLFCMVHALSSITGGYRFRLLVTRNILVTFVLHRDPASELDQRGAFHMACSAGFPPSPTLCTCAPTWILPSQRLTIAGQARPLHHGYCSNYNQICQGIVSRVLAPASFSSPPERLMWSTGNC